jgi:hypothetical protein
MEGDGRQMRGGKPRKGAAAVMVSPPEDKANINDTAKPPSTLAAPVAASTSGEGEGVACPVCARQLPDSELAINAHLGESAAA